MTNPSTKRRIERLTNLIATTDNPKRAERLHTKLASLLTVETLRACPSAFLGDGRVLSAKFHFKNAPEGMPTELPITYDELMFLLDPSCMKKAYRPPNKVLWKSDEAVLIACPSHRHPLAVCLLDRSDAEMLNEKGFLSSLHYEEKTASGQKQFVVSNGRKAALKVHHMFDWWEKRKTYRKDGYSDYDLRRKSFSDEYAYRSRWPNRVWLEL